MCDSSTPQACLVHKIAEYPVVAAGWSQLNDYYSWSKSVHPLVRAYLSLVERTAVGVYSMSEPLQRQFQHPLRLVSSVAVDGLEKLEQKYPTITKEPHEVLQDSKALYEQSLVKAGVDRALSMTDASYNKVRNAKTYCTDTVGGVIEGGQTRVADSVRQSMLMLNSVLDLTDSMVDNYILVDGASDEASAGSSDTESVDHRAVYNKALNISSKAYNGIKMRTKDQVGMLQQKTFENLEALKGTLILLEYAKANKAWANESVSNISDNLKSQYADFVAKAGHYKEQPDALLLESSQVLVGTINVLAHKLANLAHKMPLMPATAVSSFDKVTTVSDALHENIIQASTLGELKTEVLSLMRNNIDVVQTSLTDVFAQLSNYVPSDWVQSFNRLSRSSSPSGDATVTSTTHEDMTKTEPEPKADTQTVDGMSLSTLSSILLNGIRTTTNERQMTVIEEGEMTVTTSTSLCESGSGAGWGSSSGADRTDGHSDSGGQTSDSRKASADSVVSSTGSFSSSTQ